MYEVKQSIGEYMDGKDGCMEVAKKM